MKTPSEFTKQTICLLTSSSIFLASCQDNVIGINEDVSFCHDNFAPNKIKGNVGYPIHYLLTDEETGQINRFKSLAARLYLFPDFINVYKANPAKVLGEYGISGMEMDYFSQEIQIIEALSDPEIRQAIEQANLDLYLNLLSKKGLLQDAQIRQVHKALSSMNGYGDLQPDISPSLIFGAAIIVVVYVVVATVAAVEVAGWIHFAVKTKVGGNKKPHKQTNSELVTQTKALNLFLNSTPVAVFDKSFEDLGKIKEAIRNVDGVTEKDLNIALNIIYEAMEEDLYE